MDDVVFNEDTFVTGRAQPQTVGQRGRIARLFMRSGIARTEKEVDRIMVGFAVVMFLLAAFVWWFSGNEKELSSAEYRELVEWAKQGKIEPLR